MIHSAVIQNMQNTTNKFPSIGSLFSDSWNLFVSRLGRFFLLAITSFFFNALIIVIGLILAFVIVFVTNLGSALATGHTANINASAVTGVIGLLILIFLVVSIIVNSVYSAWLLLALNEPKETGFGTIFGKGFGFILPLFLIGLISFFFSIGGLFFFIIPVFLFAYFFAFSAYEVICDSQRGINAFKRSYAITTSNFGEIFVRALLIIIINVVASSLAGQLIHYSAAFAFIWIIVAILFSWYQITYFFTLYQQAKAHTDFSKPVSLLWVWIISILGWLIFIFVMFSLITGLSSLIKSGELQKILNSYAHSTPTPTPVIENNVNINYVSPAAGANNTYTYPTTAPTIDYNAKLQQEEKQAQQMQQQMLQQYNQTTQQHTQPTP